MNKITGKATSLQLISYLNALINNEEVDFDKRYLVKQDKLLNVLQKKIIGLGFSFLDMLSFLANDASATPKLKENAKELLNKLEIPHPSFNAKTQFSIKCYLGLVPKAQLKEQYITHFQSLNEKARPTFLQSFGNEKLDFNSKEEIQQFMTPLIVAICSKRIEVIKYILENHPEWLHSVYFISQSPNKIVERIFDPFIVATQIENPRICDLLKPYLKDEIAKNLIGYYKNAIKYKLCPHNLTLKIIKKMGIDDKSKKVNFDQDNEIEFLKRCLNSFTIKASKDDLDELINVAIKFNQKDYLTELLLSEDNFFSEKFNDFFLDNLHVITAKFPDLKYLELALKAYNNQAILKKSDVVAHTLQILIQRIDKGPPYSTTDCALFSNASISSIATILKNNSNKLSLLKLDKLFSEVVKKYFAMKNKRSQNAFIENFELETFLKYAYELKDAEFYNIILEYALYSPYKLKSLTGINNDANLLKYLQNFDLENFIITFWQNHTGSKSKWFFCFLFSHATFLHLDQRLLPAAIKYRRNDFFEGLILSHTRPIFNTEVIASLIDERNDFFWFLFKSFGLEITKLKFANNENIAHLVVRQPAFHFKELVEFFGNYLELFNQRDSNGLTPVHHAVLTKSHNFITHAKFLSNAVLDLNIEDNLGFTALNYASIQNDPVSYTFLGGYGAKDILTGEKQLKILEFKRKFLGALSTTPATNSTSQQNKTAPVQNLLQNTAQPQTNLNINPAQPMPQPVNQPQPVPQQNNGGNEAFHKRANNTHTASIHQSVAKSIQQLMKHYGDPNSEKIKATLKEISDYILSKIKKIRENLNLGLTDFIDEINKLLAMDRYINYISWQFKAHSLNPSTDDNRIVREVITQIPLYKIVVLVWQAAQDMSPEVNSSSALTEEDKTLRLDLVLDRFRRNGRGSNINDTTGKDLGTLDQQLCASGQVNNCVEPLEGLHNLIMILRTPESVQAYFSEKAHKLAFEFFKNFTAQQEEILSLLAQPILTDGQQVKINSFHSDVKSNVQMALEEHLRTKDNPSGMLTPETAKELLENLIYVDYEKMYFTERAIELSKEYFKKSVDSHVELYQLLNKQNRDTSEEEIVQDYFSKLRVYVKGQMKNFLITSENPTGMLTENTLLRILEELTTIEYNDVMKTLPQPKPVETNKRKFEEPINPITLIGQGDIFKKPKTKSKEPDLDDFIEAIEKELAEQEKNPSPK